MTLSSVLPNLLLLAGVAQLLTIPAALLASKLDVLRPEDIAKAGPINARLFWVVFGGIQIVIVATALATIVGRHDLCRPGSYTTMSSGWMTLLWSYRWCCQAFVLGPWFRTPRQAAVSRLLLALFAYVATTYGLTFARALAG